MTGGTRLGLALLGAAVVAGVAADALTRVWPLGIGLPLFLAIAAATAWCAASWAGQPLGGSARWLVPLALLPAAGFAWTDSEALIGFDWLTIVGLLAMAALTTRGGRAADAGIASWLVAPVVGWLLSLFGAFALVFSTIQWSETPRHAWLDRPRRVLIGLALALPPFLIFGTLLAAADPDFERVAEEVWRWLLNELFGHLLFAGVMTCLVAGVLHHAFFSTIRPNVVGRWPTRMALGQIEVSVFLAALDALFLTFVVLQVPYLFGGVGLVATSTTLTYADYARRGFFELAAVVALAVPLLLVLDWMRVQPEAAAAPPSAGRWRDSAFQVGAGAMALLLLVLCASAGQRMWLYTSAYGLTEQRLLVFAFIVWFALVIVWLAATVLVGRRRRFALGAVLSGFVLVLSLHAVNPHGLIVTVNLARAEQGAALDARYLVGLSADAVPGLVAALPLLRPEQRAQVEPELRQRWLVPQEPDWRTWNLSRWQARRQVAAALPPTAAERKPLA